VRHKSLLAAYFTMEVAIYPELKTYSGGLGVLAGDYLKSAADLRVPISAVTLLYNYGFFDQQIVDMRQQERYSRLDPIEYMTELPYTVTIEIEGREVKVGCARMYYIGNTNFPQPQYFLFTKGNEGRPWDDEITDKLYKKGDNDQDYWRIAQEQVLGIAGAKMLDLLAEAGEIELPRNYHLNEGHAGFVPFELMKRSGLAAAKARTVFTTHTPVEAGHDMFDYGKVHGMLGRYLDGIDLPALGGRDRLNMTRLALNLSRYANAVSRRHGIVSRKMFPEYAIDSITNGVHSRTWTSKVFKRLYDEYFNGRYFETNWRADPSLLEAVDRVPDDVICSAHQVAKRNLLDYIKKSTGEALDENKLTIGFARRFASYKRGDLIFSDLERLVEASGGGQVQFVFSGKAHPNDDPGKDIITAVLKSAEKLKGRVKVVFIPNYEMDKGLLLASGVDVWLNLPRRPWEASGTSGMKAAHNGVPSFSTIDGWWDEVPKEASGERRGGWSIGREPGEDELGRPDSDRADFESFCVRLRDDVRPAFADQEAWARVMKGAIRNASYFNTHRMVKEYVARAYGERLEDVIVKE
jgi:alpha-glucan phosphorylase-like protein